MILPSIQGIIESLLASHCIEEPAHSARFFLKAGQALEVRNQRLELGRHGPILRTAPDRLERISGGELQHCRESFELGPKFARRRRASASQRTRAMSGHSDTARPGTRGHVILHASLDARGRSARDGIVARVKPAQQWRKKSIKMRSNRELQRGNQRRHLTTHAATSGSCPREATSAGDGGERRHEPRIACIVGAHCKRGSHMCRCGCPEDLWRGRRERRRRGVQKGSVAANATRYE